MAFRIRHGSMDTVAGLATAAGKRVADDRAHEQALQFAMQMQAQKNRLRMAEMQMEFEFQKMGQQMENTFQMNEAVRLQGIAEEAEKERKRKNNFELAYKNVESSDILTPEERGKFLLNLKTQFHMGSSSPKVDMPMNEYQQENLRLRQEAQGLATQKAETYADIQRENIRLREENTKINATRAENAAKIAEERLGLSKEAQALNEKRFGLSEEAQALSEKRFGLSEQAAGRSAETHQKKMGSTFAEKKAASEWLQENKEPNWLQLLVPGGKGVDTPEMAAMRRQAKAVLEGGTATFQQNETGMIRVRDKVTGKTGKLPAVEFDESRYERL